MSTPKVTRIFQRFTHLERAERAASHRLGHRQRYADGEYFYVRQDIPGIAFRTRKAALAAKGDSL